MNPIRDVTYFSVDLELNNKNNGETPKIIQVGVALGKISDPENIQTFSWYLNPNEEIAPFITQLTGITDEVVQTQSVTHQVLAQELGEILQKNNVFVNPVVWGGNDAASLIREFKQQEINFPFFGRRILDVKTLFVFQNIVKGKSPSSGLQKAMRSYGLNFIGDAHRADTDALNTLRFYFYLVNRQRQIEENILNFKTIR